MCQIGRKREENRIKVGQFGTNSIAFGSAPGTEADSQPISQLVRQAVSHAVSRASRQAVSWADTTKQFGFLQ